MTNFSKQPGFTPLNRGSRLSAGNLTGFTLIEIMTAISLMVIMLTLSVISYNSATKRTELALTAQQLASNFRLAQTYAASAKSPDANPVDNIWGLYFDVNNPKQIIMFVDKNKDGLYKEADDVKYKVIDLPSQVEVSKLFFSNSQETNQQISNSVAITFVPPDPKVRFCQVGSANCNNSDSTSAHWSENWDSVRIVLQNQLDSSVVNVSINFFGLIDVLNL
jgi:Tfp pilus assembly protein FimT